MEAKPNFIQTKPGRILCIVAVLIVIAGLVFGAIQLFDKGENVIQGSWQYYAKITSAGDIDSVFHFAEDGSFYLQSIHAVNYGTYELIKGGNEGTFITKVVGEEIMYDYVRNGDILTITTLDGYSMQLHKIS
jgi:hypothetical protein